MTNQEMLDAMQTLLYPINSKLENIDLQMKALDAKTANIDLRLESLEHRVKKGFKKTEQFVFFDIKIELLLHK